MGARLLLPAFLAAGVVAVVPLHLVAIEGRDVGADAVREPAIMRSAHGHAGEGVVLAQYLRQGSSERDGEKLAPLLTFDYPFD